MRVILAFVYWKQVSSNADINEFEGISISEVINLFRGQYSQDDIIETITTLSEFCDSGEKRDLVNQWGYLITFVQGVEETSIQNSLATQARWDSIKFRLSSAGWCFVDSISSEFEFFSSRTPLISKVPLVLFGDRKINSADYSFDDTISNVFKYTKYMILALRETALSICSSSGCNHFSCLGFLCLREIFSVLTSHINYIDDYRRYMWTTYNNKDINTKLLDHIANYGMLFAEFSDVNNCFAVTDHQNSKSIVARKKAVSYYARRMDKSLWEKTIKSAKSELSDGTLYHYIKDQP